MRRTIFLLAAFVLFIAVSFAFTAKTEAPPRYKNLKVLPKDISKEQMDSVMHQFAGSLGVRCSYCHAFNEQQKAMDFASDEKKEKGAARSMLKMMYKLNHKYFDIKSSKALSAHLEVTCYTCHHGQAHPMTRLPAMQGEGGNGGNPPAMGQRMTNDSTKH